MKYKIDPKEKFGILYVRGVDKELIKPLEEQASSLGYSFGEFLNILFKKVLEDTPKKTG